MRDPARIPKVLAAIGEVWTRHPDLRLGQLIVKGAGGDPFYIEDEVLVEELRAMWGNTRD